MDAQLSNSHLVAVLQRLVLGLLFHLVSHGQKGQCQRDPARDAGEAAFAQDLEGQRMCEYIFRSDMGLE